MFTAELISKLIHKGQLYVVDEPAAFIDRYEPPSDFQIMPEAGALPLPNVTTRLEVYGTRPTESSYRQSRYQWAYNRTDPDRIAYQGHGGFHKLTEPRSEVYAPGGQEPGDDGLYIVGHYWRDPFGYTAEYYEPYIREKGVFTKQHIANGMSRTQSLIALQGLYQLGTL